MATGTKAPADIVKPTAENTLAVFTDMLNIIPAAEDDDAEADMVARILAGETLEDATASLTEDKVYNLIGEQFVIDSIVRRQSDAANGGGQYLQCQVRRAAGAGESVRWSTGSTMCMAVLVRAYAEGRIPGLLVLHRQAEKPTKAGNLPRNLIVIGQHDAILG